MWKCSSLINEWNCSRCTFHRLRPETSKSPWEGQCKTGKSWNLPILKMVNCVVQLAIESRHCGVRPVYHHCFIRHSISKIPGSPPDLMVIQILYYPWNNSPYICLEQYSVHRSSIHSCVIAIFPPRQLLPCERLTSALICLGTVFFHYPVLHSSHVLVLCCCLFFIDVTAISAFWFAGLYTLETLQQSRVVEQIFSSWPLHNSLSSAHDWSESQLWSSTASFC